MSCLIIDTATERPIVALVVNETLEYYKELPFGLRSSEHLLPELEQLKIDQCESIIVGVGPGSYTGIRVGVMAAQTISYAKKIPLVGISTLAAFVPNKRVPYAALIDAKSRGLYLMKEGGDPMLVPPEAIDATLADIALVMTPNLHAVKGKVTRHVEWQESCPDPMRFYLLGQEKLLRGESSTRGEVEIKYVER